MTFSKWVHECSAVEYATEASLILCDGQENRVLSLYRESDGAITFREQCDGYYSVTMTPDEAILALQEAIAWIREGVMATMNELVYALNEPSVYLVIIHGRHREDEVDVYCEQQHAISAAQQIVAERRTLGYEPEDDALNDMNVADGWVYFGSYSDDGEYVRVVKRKVCGPVRRIGLVTYKEILHGRIEPTEHPG